MLAYYILQSIGINVSAGYGVGCPSAQVTMEYFIIFICV